MIDTLLGTNLKKTKPSWPQMHRFQNKMKWGNRISNKETITCKISNAISITYPVPLSGGFDWVLENEADFPVPGKTSVLKRSLWLKFQNTMEGCRQSGCVWVVHLIVCCISLRKRWFCFFLQKIRWSHHQTYSLLVRQQLAWGSLDKRSRFVSLIFVR